MKTVFLLITFAFVFHFVGQMAWKQYKKKQ
jgi:hypothetical protein